MKVALYARVSKEEGQTPENQLDIIRPLAEKRGYEVVAEYVDRASGKDANRPKFAAMMEAARNNEFEAIVAVRLDRVMRSLIQLHTILQQLEVFKVSLILSDMEFDPKTPNGKLTINIIASIAEWERGMISQRTKEGLAHRKAKGIKLGKALRDDLPLLEIAHRRIEGWGWKRIADTYGIPKSTLIGRKADIDTAIESVKGSDNLPTENKGSDKEGGF